MSAGADMDTGAGLNVGGRHECSPYVVVFMVNLCGAKHIQTTQEPYLVLGVVSWITRL